MDHLLNVWTDCRCRVAGYTGPTALNCGWRTWDEVIFTLEDIPVAFKVSIEKQQNNYLLNLEFWAIPGGKPDLDLDIRQSPILPTGQGFKPCLDVLNCVGIAFTRN